MNSSIDYAFAYDEYKESERRAAEEKAAIRKVLAKHFDCFVSDESIEEAANEVWDAMQPEIEALF